MISNSRVVALPGGEHLPLVGELHPLRQSYERILFHSASVALVFHLAAIGTWVVLRPEVQPESSVGPLPTGRDVEIVPPPSIVSESVVQVTILEPVTPPAIGVPEPVPDFQAAENTFATMQQISEMLTPTDLTSVGGDGGAFDLDTALEGALPAPTDFVSREEEPRLISLPAPVYPDLARRAGIEGRVLVRALVGKDGHVLDAFVLEGNSMLTESALRSVRAAIFRPALQQQRPIAVWVVIPLQFVLSD